MSTDRQNLEAAIAALESKRAQLGDAVIDAALAPLRAKLASVTAAPADGPPAQSLKQVTILFLDIVASTTLSQHLDPEETHAVMDGALSSFTAIVGALGGKVLNYAGDSMLAVFGADEAREDDPERAVRAGLALLDEGKRQGELVRRSHGHAHFNVRIGVHTGRVLLGGGVDAEGSIRGLAVNIAARMEQTAPEGSVRISHDTYRHVRGVFDVESQPPILVKGVDEPIVTYLVQRAKPRAFRVAARGIEGVETRMIGREADLQALQEAFLNVCQQSRLTIVVVAADAGMGKSRLLYEFQNWAESRPESFYLFHGRALPQTRSQPYGLLRDILAWRFQIVDSDSMETAKKKWGEGIAPFLAAAGDDTAEAQAHLLGHLIGLDYAESRHVRPIVDDGVQIRNRAFHAAALMFRRVAGQGNLPIVLLLDDLHWADEGSLDYLRYLVKVNHDVAMLILGLTRPTLFELHADWPGVANMKRVDLAPLDKEASRVFANELLKNLDAVPLALRDLLSDRADGNPFYMEELVKMLVDEGAIETHGERWNFVPGRLLSMHVPPTLTGVLQARLDGLKPVEKLALQQASVIGFVFWDRALSAIDARGTARLPRLTERALVLPHPEASLDGVREYVFHHQILHQVTYDTVLKRVRREYHAKVAAWLAGLTSARANDFLAATAEHYEKAGDNGRACEFYTRAAEHARDRFAHEAVMGHVARALALTSEAAESGPNETRDQLAMRWRLHNVRERTLDLQGRRLEQRADIGALEQLADTMDDDHLRTEAALRRCDIELRLADWVALERVARQAMALAARVGDDALRLRAQQRLAVALNMHGDGAAGKALAEEGLAAARALGLRLIEGMFLNSLAIIASMQDDQVLHLEFGRLRLAIDRELGNRRGEAMTLCNLGNAWFGLGEYDEARRSLEEGLQLTRAIGDRGGEPLPLICLADIARRQRDNLKAVAYARSAVDIAVEVQSPESETSALCVLGDVELALGHHAAANAAFERAHAVALAIDDALQYDAAAGMARAALTSGDAARALVTVEGLLAHLAGGGTFEGSEAPLQIEFTCYQVLARAGDPRAKGLLERAHAGLHARASAIVGVRSRQLFLTAISEHRQIVEAWNSAR